MGFHHVGSAGLELLTSSDLPASASRSAGITGLSHRAWPDVQFFFLCLASCLFSLEKFRRARWLKLVIPALWEAKAGVSRGQDIETILVNMVKPRLY